MVKYGKRGNQGGSKGANRTGKTKYNDTYTMSSESFKIQKI